MHDFLKAAADVGQNLDNETLPENVLSFLLVYADTPDLTPDLTVERSRLEQRLEGDGFSLFALSEDDPTLLVLAFYGVENDQSADFLFELAEVLRDNLNLVAVEPETGPQYGDLNTPAIQTESLGGIVDWFCRSNAGAHDDGDWPLKMMKVDRAIAAHGVTGAGIRVGQPDTGVATHDELAGALNTSLGANFVEGGPNPVDPLLPSMSSPGHGTGAASVMVSRHTLRISGTAPGAELVPIRVTNGPVLGLGLALARGIDHARHQGCNVISISLGTITPGRAVRRAVERAVAADIIVIAAAGNCVGVVVYPGWDRNVIAVAGVDRAGERWVGSCRGGAVDVSAPAENVHKAKREPGAADGQALRAIDPLAQGTTFATAMTAGVAALWLEKFGLQNTRDVARAHGLPVQELFREALRASADTPGGWDSSEMGSGIVDAMALLDLPLEDIVIGPTLETGPTLESGGPATEVFGVNFDQTGLQQEADFIAVQQLAQTRGTANMLPESATGIRPSRRLQEALDTLDGQGDTPPAALSSMLNLAPEAALGPLSGSLRRLYAAQSSGLESTASVDDATALATLRANGSDALLERAEQAFGTRTGAADASVQADALRRMRPVIDELLAGPDPTAMPNPETPGVLEALVRLTGRPAIRLQADGSEIEDPLWGTWADHIVPTRNEWREKTDAVGRIDAEIKPGKWVPVGTGILIADGRVLTNRHVIDAFAERRPTRDGSQHFHLRFPISIIFDPAATDDATRFALPSVLSAGHHRIAGRMNLAKLDAAILEMTMDNGQREPPFPMPAGTTTVADTDLTRMLVSGYPLEPSKRRGGPSATADPDLHDQFWDRIEELFGDQYGVQYMCPGLIELRPGAVPFDPNGWAFTHDATTLGGNSGSVIISLHGAMPMCGLHFGGQSLAANYAHDIEVIRAVGDGVFQTQLLPT